MTPFLDPHDLHHLDHLDRVARLRRDADERRLARQTPPRAPRRRRPFGARPGGDGA